MEPIVAVVLGGGTSAMVMRGDDQMLAGDGVRATVDGPQTSAATGTASWAIS